MNRRLLAFVVTGLVTLLAASAATAAQTLRATRLVSITFPDRAYVLTTTKPMALNSANVRVRENGNAVDGASVVSASAVGAAGTVLLLDASNSMRGEPIANEMKAARAFVARNPNQPLAVIALNDRITSLLSFTTNREQIREALATTPKNREGTHIYDAVAQAVRQLKSAHLRAGRIVLLSDGQEVRSTVSRETALDAAKNAGVRVYTIGLQSYAFDAEYLKGLSSETGATYAEATAPKQLERIYSQLGFRFANEYLLRYRSLAGPEKTVRVEISVAGVPGVVTASYRTPALPSTSPPPFHRGFFDRFLASSASVAVMSLLAAGLVWFAISALLRSRRSGLGGRIGEYSTESAGSLGTDPESLRTRERLLSHVLLTAERAFERAPWWDRFKEELDIAQFSIRPVPLAAGTIALTIVAAVVFGLISPLLALFALGVPFVVRSVYKRKLAERRKAFEAQMPDNLTVLAASLRAGHSFVGALSSVLDEAEEPSRSELRRAVSDEQLGVPIEDALLRVARRMNSADLEQVALVASLQRETGGNTAEVLDAVVDSVRERFQLRRLVATLTAQGRLARWILTLLPLITGLVIAFLNPGYLSPLFTTTTGQMLLGLAVVLVIVGSFAIKRITEIEI